MADISWNNRKFYILGTSGTCLYGNRYRPSDQGPVLESKRSCITCRVCQIPLLPYYRGFPSRYQRYQADTYNRHLYFLPYRHCSSSSKKGHQEQRTQRPGAVLQEPEGRLECGIRKQGTSSSHDHNFPDLPFHGHVSGIRRTVHPVFL